MSNIVFMGTPSFAVPSLMALHEAFGVGTVVTMPDKPKGRGLAPQSSAVYQAAVGCGIPTIMQPSSLKDPAFAEAIADIRPDVICVIAFRILPRSVYSLARLGAFNVHASLLPKYRGAAPINHAIINGDSQTGVTSFLLNDVVDTGSILHQLRLDITPGMTAGELYDALMPLAADCAVRTCRALLDGTAVPMQQHDGLATPAPKVFRATSSIQWTANAAVVRNFIHGLSPVPCAWTVWRDQPLKIFRASMSEHSCDVGRWRIVDDALIAGCADGALSLDVVQLPGKSQMAFADVARGFRGAAEGTFT